MRKDDLLGNSPSPRPQPPLISSHMPLLQEYTRDCKALIDFLLAILETHLELPPRTLRNLHRIDAMSGDHVRFNRTSATPFDLSRAKEGEHTDFGTLTVLFNWVGGLQIRLPEGVEAVLPEAKQANGVNGTNGTHKTNSAHKTNGPHKTNGVNGVNGVNGHAPTNGADEEEQDRWVWVKPLPGKAIINLGDALVQFSAGILRSNVHRVVSPAPPQNDMERDSLVFFTRPEDDVVLRRLKGGLIDAQPKKADDDIGVRSDEWVLRRSQGDLVGVWTHEKGLEKRVPYD